MGTRRFTPLGGMHLAPTTTILGGMSKAIAFVATSQPEQALAFYRDVLGLRLVEDTPFAIVFDAFGTMLRIQKAERVTRAPYTAFGLDVRDLAARVRELAKHGVVGVRYPHFIQDELAIWTAPDGARVFWFHDPDGNLLSLSQFGGS
jgi:catechol 2,3-dioxygenase-like lactoylglutathione lyase family enzyme